MRTPTVSSPFTKAGRTARVLVNTEFKNSLDLNVLAHLQRAATDKIILPEYYVSQLLSMMPFSDEWTVDTVLNPKFGKEAEWEAGDSGWNLNKGPETDPRMGAQAASPPLSGAANLPDGKEDD